MSDLKTAKKLFKQALRPMGVYQIKNRANGKIYIGRGFTLLKSFHPESPSPLAGEGWGEGD